MKRRLTAIIAAAIITLSCIISVSAASCPNCGGNLEAYGCTMPNISNMAYSTSSTCTEHSGTGCKLVVYYAYSKARCSDCGRTNNSTLTHACAIAHQVNGVNDEVMSCCQYW